MADLPINEIICGDCLDIMKGWPSDLIDCCVTSPPYWGLRDYGTATWEGGKDDCKHYICGDGECAGEKQKTNEGSLRIAKDICPKCGAERIDRQLGLEKTPEEYVEKMVRIFQEVKRVLKPEGTLFLNLGDSYFTNPGNGRGGGSTLQGAKPHLSGSKRVTSCGTSCKEPANSQHHGCLCENLCDACRLVYQSHRFRNDGLLVAMLSASLSLPTQESRESESGHFPTLDFSALESRILAAIQNFGRFPLLSDEQLLSLRESTPDESSRQLLAECWRRGSVSSCLLCGHSLTSGVPSSEHKKVCTCGTGENGHPFDSGKSDISSLRKAYPHYTITLPVSKILKPKDLCGIPWMVAFALRQDGWYLRQDIIWHKPNPMPESVRDRCTKAHEYIFLLTKKPRYYYDADAIKEESVDPESFSGRRLRNAGNMDSTDPDNYKFHGSIGNDGKLPSGQTYPTRNKRSVWTVTTKPYSEAHFATFPPDLIEPCILAGCPEWVCPKCGKARERIVERSGGTTGESWHDHEDDIGKGIVQTRGGVPLSTAKARKEKENPYKVETTGWTDCGCGEGFETGVVLDPFMGSGTTAMVAYENRRNYVGCELNPEYIKLNRADKAKEKYGLFE